MFAFLGLFGLQLYTRERRRLHEIQNRQDEREQQRLELEKRRLEREEAARYEAESREQKRLELERQRLEHEETALYETERREEEKLTSDKAGLGSGGYIVMEMPDKDRPLFHDLLKGFEDYATLKGYHLAFSIDSTFQGRIAFKFTIQDGGVVVGPERVREDFKEYVDKVRTGQIEDFDKMPIITNLEEHNLVVALLKNRISFLQHSYSLSQNAVKYYESLITNTRYFPALPSPSVVVQTGGNMDSRSYNAQNSSRLIQGNSNTYTDSSVNIDIGNSFNERQERIAALDDLIDKMQVVENLNEPAQKMMRDLGKVRDELAEAPEPDKSMIRKWLEGAKNLMTSAILGYELTEAATKLFHMFGLS